MSSNLTLSVEPTLKKKKEPSGFRSATLELRSISSSNTGYLILSLPLFTRAREANLTVPHAAEQKDGLELSEGYFS